MSVGQFTKWCASKLLKTPLEQGLGHCKHPSVLKKIYGHINGFDYARMNTLLKETGFNKIYRSQYRDSRYPVLRKPAFDLESRKHFALYVEAVKK
jgi:hypothetical protein